MSINKNGFLSQNLAISPDSSLIALVIVDSSGTQNSQIVIIDAASGDYKESIEISNSMGGM